MKGLRPTRRGFTLLEIMVSIALLSTIMLMTSRIFTQSTQAIDRGKKSVLLDDTARRLLDTMEEDISQALLRSNVVFSVVFSNELHMVSTGIKHELISYKRDVSPVILKAETAAIGYSVVLRHPGTSSITNLSKHSNFYNGDNFIDDNDLCGATSAYNDPVESAFQDQTDIAVVNSLNFAPGPLNQNGKPRYIDLTVNLIDLKSYNESLLHSAPTAFRNQHKHQYSRRIYMRNIGAEQLLD